MQLYKWTCPCVPYIYKASEIEDMYIYIYIHLTYFQL